MIDLHVSPAADLRVPIHTRVGNSVFILNTLGFIRSPEFNSIYPWWHPSYFKFCVRIGEREADYKFLNHLGQPVTIEAMEILHRRFT